MGGTGVRVSTVSVGCALVGCGAARGCGSGVTGLGFGSRIDVQGADSICGGSVTIIGDSATATTSAVGRPTANSAATGRSTEERRGGKESGKTGKSRWAP